MAKKKSKKTQFLLKPWCWYCEREFEDEKVLLQHQKAKHFKCRHCPRKLNTAGGLMVHCQQVHKTEPDKLENTLPGRDGYDIEIFGMEGVPAKDQTEWKQRKEAEWGVNLSNLQNQQKRPRIFRGVIGAEELRKALEMHKGLMSGQGKGGMGLNGLPPPTMIPAGPPMFLPPNGFAPPFPPNSNGFPPPFPPSGNFSMPPPNFPPGQFPPPPGQFGFPPGAGAMGMGSPFPPPPAPSSAFSAPGGQAALSWTPASALAPMGMMESKRGLEDTVEVLPAKDGFMWPDMEASPAEKRAQQPRYRYTSPTPALAPTYPTPQPSSQPPLFAQTSAIPSASGFAPSASNLQDKGATTPILEAPAGVEGGIRSSLSTVDGSGVKPGEEVEGMKVEEGVPISAPATGTRKRKAAEDFL